MRLFLIAVITALTVFHSFASSPKYVELADSADNFISVNRWEDAERVITEALRLEPGAFTNSLLLSNLGIVHTNLGRADDALDDFRMALTIAPGSSVIRNNRARTYLAVGDYQKALRDIDDSLAIDSIQEWPLKMRGMLLLRDGDIEGANKDFSTLTEKFPKNADAWAGLAAIAESRGNTREAVSLYDKAVELEDNPETRFSRILLKINAEMYTEASEDLSDSIRKYPEVADLYVLRAYLNKLNFRNPEAEMDKKIALDKGAELQFIERFFPVSRK